ncbi:MAG: hypothetical protein ACQEP3_00140 [Patescibacteria group bacterium]
MTEKERLVNALISFYKKIAAGVRPTEMLVLRISKENRVEKTVFIQFINKINRQLVSEKIDSSWNIKQKIEEVVNPKRAVIDNYTKALEELSELAPDITTFEVEKIIIRYNLNREQKEKLRSKAEKLRDGIYRSTNLKKNRLEKAKKKIREEFLKNPSCITKEKITKIANNHGIVPIELKRFYKENYKEWTQIREKANTIEELLK